MQRFCVVHHRSGRRGEETLQSDVVLAETAAEALKPLVPTPGVIHNGDDYAVAMVVHGKRSVCEDYYLAYLKEPRVPEDDSDALYFAIYREGHPNAGEFCEVETEMFRNGEEPMGECNYVCGTKEHLTEVATEMLKTGSPFERKKARTLLALLADS